jgi:hypothetical protein
MRTLLCLPVLLALPLLGVAQTTAPDKSKIYVNVDPYTANNIYTMPPADAGTVKGSPFLLPGWTQANVQLVGNMNPTPTTLRYDVFRQELRVRRTQGDSVVVPLSRVKEFTFTGTGQRFVCYPPAMLPAEVAGACAEVLADGPHLQLLKFWRKEIVKKPADNTSYGSNSMMDVLQQTTRYYLRWPTDGHLTAVRLKRSSLEQALASQPAALAALKARKGSIGSEAELAAAVVALDPTVVAGR